MSQYLDNLAAKYAAIFVESFSGIDASCWDKPWMAGGLAPHQNITGDAYRGTNRMAALMRASKEGYRTSVWGTFLQWKGMGIKVAPGEHAMPVSYFDLYVKDRETGARTDITPDEYHAMDDEQRKRYDLRSDLYSFSVFNADQTDMKTAFPDVYDRIVKASVPGDRSAQIAAADAVAGRTRNWICPVAIVEGKAPLYHRGLDAIWMPPKEEFNNYKDFYACLFRAMAHSTGAKHALDRPELLATSVEGNAREELICEFASALVSNRCGLAGTLGRENLQYLKLWTERVTEDPKYIYSVMKDASKAADMICNGLGLGEVKGVDMRPLLPEARPVEKNERSSNRGKDARKVRAASEKVVRSAKPVTKH